MTTLTLYNTLSRAKDRFSPQDNKRVTMYVCGPTVYNHPHIGNARPAVVFDVLFRVLRYIYGEDHVVYARNITDVDDKINAAAAEQEVDISVITERFTQVYHDDMGALGVMLPSIEPRATAHMGEMIAMMQKLVDGGHAYAAEGHLLFDTASYDPYGALSRRELDEMIAGARVEVAPYKRNPADFVLWKPSTQDQPGWDSPWGRGRPGWHIECSAMIATHLGETIDIHGGGSDLVFPHHENEIAQSSCAHGGAPIANYWMHNGFVNMGKEKMSKSLGNVLLVKDLVARHPGEAVRLALLNAQYRQPLDWSEDGLAQAKAMLDRLYGAVREMADIEAPAGDPHPDFLAAVSDDLNTPKAISVLFELAEAAFKAPSAEVKSQLLASGAILGLLQQDPEAWFQSGVEIDPAEIDALLQERQQARADKNFARADEIRDDLAARGIVIEDRPDGAIWRKA